MTVIGHPTLGKVKQVMLGMRFTNCNSAGSMELWYGFKWNCVWKWSLNESGDMVPPGKLDVQLADLEKYHKCPLIGQSPGSKVLSRRQKDLRPQLDINANLELSKFLQSMKVKFHSMLNTAWIVLPQNTILQKDLDVKLQEKLTEATSTNARDSILQSGPWIWIY